MTILTIVIGVWSGWCSKWPKSQLQTCAFKLINEETFNVSAERSFYPFYWVIFGRVWLRNWYNSKCYILVGYTLALEASKRGIVAAMSKDLSWLWRIAYNSAIAGLGIWRDSDVTTAFILARNVGMLLTELAMDWCVILKLMEVTSGFSLAEFEQEILEYRIMASFAVISGQCWC